MTGRLATTGLLGAAAVAFALGPVAVPNYSLVSQSISETAAQATPGAWVARSGFALLGMAVLSARSHAQVGRPSAMAYSAFALGLFGVGVWSHEPYLADLPYDATEASLHSLVAAGMGLAIVTAEVLAAWHTRRKGPLLLASAYLLLPAAMNLHPAFAGVYQRLMFALLIASLLVRTWRPAAAQSVQ